MKKVITWKDADQNLCTIAAAILDNASSLLRASGNVAESYPTDGGGSIEPGFAEPSGNRTYWSGVVTNDFLPTDYRALGQGPSYQCWFCFQNMVRLRLEDARRELKRNRYLRKNAFKSSKQRSRNKITRPETGKAGRRPERE